MGRPAVRYGDMSTGHTIGSCSWIPTPYSTPITSSVFVNGLLAGAVGDMFTPHVGKPCKVWHGPGATPRPITTGSMTVFVEGRSMARIGDMVELDFIAQGSHNVFVGG